MTPSSPTRANVVGADEHREATEYAGLLFFVLVAAFLLIASFTWVQMQPPIVTIDATYLRVERGLVRTTRELASVRQVVLDSSRMLVSGKISGFAFGQSKRGRFRLNGKVEVELYVTQGKVPYVRIESDGLPLYINFDDPQQTIALFDRLRLLAPPRVGVVRE